jgi:hypothetical protein
MFLGWLLSPFGGDGGGDDWCEMFFWKCTAHAEAPEQHKWRDLHVQLIGPGRGRGRVCQTEDRVIGIEDGGSVSTLIYRHPAYYLEDCDAPLRLDILQYCMWTFQGQESKRINSCVFDSHSYWADRITQEWCVNGKCSAI